MSSKKIGVIGAGSQGLTTIKALKEEGLDPVCFERTADMGGLWRFHDDDIEGLASVMTTTVINSCKEMTAFSDFPPDEDAPNFMHNKDVYGMLKKYAERFDLLRHIHFKKEVVEVCKAEDYDDTGNLSVSVRDTHSGKITHHTFEGVVVCIGHHVYPHVPPLSGQESFRGTLMHTHHLKRVAGFEDKVVVVVGVGNSGLDAAVEIGSVAKQVYLSSRRGVWVLPRLGPLGLPLDLAFTRRYLQLLNDHLLPFGVSCGQLEGIAEARCDHGLYGLRPAHRILSQHSTQSDVLPVRLATGAVRMRGDVKGVVEQGVVFEGEGEVTRCDAIVLATGYDIKFPFLKEGLVDVSRNQVHLYKYVFPPHLKHPTLAIAGLIQVLGGSFPIFEAHARWIAQVFSGNVRLPAPHLMEADILRKRQSNARRYVNSQRHTIQVDYIPYLDEIYSQIGARPSLFRMLLSDPVLFFYVFFGPSLPYQYRLQGPHPWAGARRAIVECGERVAKPFGGKLDVVFVPFRETFLAVFFGLVLVVGVASYLLF